MVTVTAELSTRAAPPLALPVRMHKKHAFRTRCDWGTSREVVLSHGCLVLEGARRRNCVAFLGQEGAMLSCFPLGGSRGLAYLESRPSHAAPLSFQAQSALHLLGPRFCTSRRRRLQLERPRHVSMLRWHGGGYTAALTTLAIKAPNDSMYDTIQGRHP